MKRIICSCMMVLWLTTACGGRLPQTKRSTEIIRKHFTKYAKKYSTSPFGHKKVTAVEILEVKEIRKHLVYTISFVTMEGPEVFKVRVTLEKGPFGWRYVAWENVGG